jgi:hypothetical protein
MAPPSPERELAAVAAVTRSFFTVVPARYSKYCALNASIAAHALHRLGVACEVVPCQVVCSLPNGVNTVVGFVGAAHGADRWDGHAICASGSWFIDAALSHLSDEFRIEAPAIVAGRRVTFVSQAIARHDLSPTHRVWWHHPPHGFDATPPPQNPQLVHGFGDALFEKARRELLAAA